MLLWWPELAQKGMESKLLKEGIYGRVRHPRYVSTMVGMIGFALFTNYSGAYVVVALTLPGLYLITILEERELLVRFGEEYRHYQEEVPRLIPRLTS
jgi:protein-S-isoprenylcysteine O-methyltransferase Ste14